MKKLLDIDAVDAVEASQELIETVIGKENVIDNSAGETALWIEFNSTTDNMKKLEAWLDDNGYLEMEDMDFFVDSI